MSLGQRVADAPNRLTVLCDKGDSANELFLLKFANVCAERFSQQIELFQIATPARNQRPWKFLHLRNGPSHQNNGLIGDPISRCAIIGIDLPIPAHPLIASYVISA